MTRPRDEAFEVLAHVTGTDWSAGRGELNKALASIREQADGEEELQYEITERARLYRRQFPNAALTPTALAKHWKRVYEESRREQGTNLSSSRICETCRGNRFVIVGTRPLPTTIWMREHGFKARGEVDEAAPCPSCNAEAKSSFRRHDGSMFVGPDAGRVMEMLDG